MRKQLSKGWTVARLEDFTRHPKQDIVDGPFGSNLKASEYVAGGVPIIRLQNVDRNRFVEKNICYVTPKKAAELARHSFRPADVIITKLGDPVGKACIVPVEFSPGIIVADIVRARIDEQRAINKFVAYAINSPAIAAQLNLETKGTTRPRVNLSHIRSLKIPLPPLTEQERIVNLLDEVDALRKLRAEADRRSADLIPALFHDMFDDHRRCRQTRPRAV